MRKRGVLPWSSPLVHSQSRFFRDLVQYVTQPTGEVLTGELLRRMISRFDEYQSQETGKHTRRAMQENARQACFNRSFPPFGTPRQS